MIRVAIEERFVPGGAVILAHWSHFLSSPPADIQAPPGPTWPPAPGPVPPWEPVLSANTICLRIGHCVESNTPRHPQVSSSQIFGAWLGHRDSVQIMRESLEARPYLALEISHGASNDKWRLWDIEHAREAIRFEHKDNAEDYRDTEEM